MRGGLPHRTAASPAARGRKGTRMAMMNRVRSASREFAGRRVRRGAPTDPGAGAGRPLRQHTGGGAGWVAIAALVVIWDMIAPETLSSAFHRATSGRLGGAAVLVTWAVLTAHLFQVLPERADPVRYSVGALRSGWIAVFAGKRDGGQQYRAVRWRAADLHRSAKCADTVSQPVQSAGL